MDVVCSQAAVLQVLLEMLKQHQTDPKFRTQQASLEVEALPSPSLQQILIKDPATRPGTDFVVTGDVTTFKVVYAVLNPANIDLRNVEILVTSDTESVKVELRSQHFLNRC